MHLRRLELQGFKTFAQKTVLEFISSAEGHQGITAIVGPNGSGKSNLADAMRWVMGEQSFKLLRSKKSEDIIFSGSERRARSGFAEVSMTLVNEKETRDVDLSEIFVTRRLYRDGTSEYEVNKQSARLTDVILLLAQCGIGQRTYSVIGQGMVDAVLSASPRERKEFFDEAAGLRVFQLKKHQAETKLVATRENLTQADLRLNEIEPRLRLLERQAKRLKEREGIEEELRRLERLHFGNVWRELKEKLQLAHAKHQKVENVFAAKNADAEKFEQELARMERATPMSREAQEIRDSLDALKEERARLREAQIRFDAKRELAHAHAEKSWAPLPLSKIIEELNAAVNVQQELATLVAADTLDVKRIRAVVERLQARSREFLARLQRPAPEETGPLKTSHANSEQEREQLSKAITNLTDQIAEVETRLAELLTREEASRKHFFETQHQLNTKRREAQEAERNVAETFVELARLETRREAFFSDLRLQAPHLEETLDQGGEGSKQHAASSRGVEAPEAMYARMQKLRSQLEWIGGIDQTTIAEYEETQTSYTTLKTQAEDLRQAIRSLETVIAELETTIKERGDAAFLTLNTSFGVYFKKLFGGGDARLIQLHAEPALDEEGSSIEGEEANPEGIEMQATPPGKRLKSIALLSGGERALTSIALICAILATNPSPFVVLDEVDAALDEVNSKKFADILASLADKTQFVVITHNRATMNTANVLYGVTMGDGGVSQVLSVKLE